MYFISDGIRTIEDNGGEHWLTIMAMAAQDESRKISERSKAGQYISRNNGVLYGSGNILGYTRIRKRSDSDKQNAIGDKSVPTFAIMPEEAETVRMIFAWYLEGLGLRRIKALLMIQERKNSSGKVKWFESSISRLLSNPMYIGKQYQCQTEVVDYLEHTVKKNKKEDYVLIEGDFDPIISEELFNRVQEIKRQRNSQGHIGDRHYSCRVSMDKWLCRLECCCGSKFQRYTWRQNASGEKIIGYTCRHRAVDGSADYRIKKGLLIGDACSMPTIPAWKFDFMALKIFSDIWKRYKDCIDAVDLFLRQYNAENSGANKTADIEGLQKQIKRFEGKIRRITKYYTERKITAEKFEEKSKACVSKLEDMRERLAKAQQNAGKAKRGFKECNRVCEILAEWMDFSGEWIDENIVRNFVDKIVMQSATEFDWYINLYGDAADFLDKNDTRYCNESHDVKAQKTKMLQHNFYELIFTFHMTLEDAQIYKEKFGKFVRANQWKDITVNVYMR